jgi:putative proteasome-type protease
MLVRDGLVMIADTRTNAGVDDVSQYRKLRVHSGDARTIGVASAGSLSTTQAAMQMLNEGIVDEATEERETLDSVPSMFRAARLVGKALRMARTGMKSVAQGSEVNFDATLLVGGSIGVGRPHLFLVYPTGNCIECWPDTPYLQIGENKYGKPILDRALTYETDLYETLKIGLISFSSTMRSNLAVGLPLDVLAIRSGTTVPEVIYRIESDDAYFDDLNARWGEALRHAREEIPTPPYAPQPTGTAR